MWLKQKRCITFLSSPFKIKQKYPIIRWPRVFAPHLDILGPTNVQDSVLTCSSHSPRHGMEMKVNMCMCIAWPCLILFIFITKQYLYPTHTHQLYSLLVYLQLSSLWKREHTCPFEVVVSQSLPLPQCQYQSIHPLLYA